MQVCKGKHFFRKSISQGDILEFDVTAVLHKEIGRLVFVIVAVGGECRHIAVVHARLFIDFPGIIGLKQSCGVVSVPIGPEVGVEFGIVPGLSHHTVEEEGQVEAFPGHGNIETAYEFRLVGPENHAVLGIDDLVAVGVHISESAHSRCTVLHIVSGSVFIHLSLGTEDSVGLVSEPGTEGITHIGDIVSVAATPGVINILRELCDAVFVEGSVETDVIVEVLHAVSPADGELESSVAHSSHILERISSFSQHSGIGRFVEHILGLLVEEVETGSETA